jgi:hypothetical protein
MKKIKSVFIFGMKTDLITLTREKQKQDLTEMLNEKN